MVAALMESWTKVRLVLGATTLFQFTFLLHRLSNIQENARIGWENTQERHASMQFDGLKLGAE